MGLYGLDLIIDKKGEKYICEINGVCSGMNGFKEIYGDDRVKDEAFGILEKKYGLLTVNDGTFMRNNLKAEHPILYQIGKAISKSKLIRRILTKPNLVFSSPNSEIYWIDEDVKNIKFREFPFDCYNGQESVVINIDNGELPHPMVNSFVSEEIARNKFLQYMLLKNSEISDYILESSPVGLGAVDEKKLEKLLLENDSFVVKPILGSCGKGVKFLNKKEVKSKYSDSRGPINFANLQEALLLPDKAASNLVYFEDLVDRNDFSFEWGLSLLQPFIDSRKKFKEDQKYSSIRAIICERKFIDAYQRVSPNKKVNLSQDASSIPFKFGGDFATFCEDVIETFEGETEKYDSKSFKKILYSKYIEERGRTSKLERKSDVFNSVLDRVLDVSLF